MAVFASAMALPSLNWISNSPVNFLCIALKANGQTSYSCSPLYMNTEDYWTNDDAKGWAGALRAGALFGIVAVSTGFMALALLMTATCFDLKLRRLLSIIILQGIAMFCSIFTLIGGAADICDYAGIKSGCSKDKMRVDTGAGFMIFACFLYIAAGVMTTFFFLAEKKRQQPPLNPEEAQRLTNTTPPMMASPVVKMVQQPAPVAGDVSVTKTVMPNGSVKTEREFIDEEGQLVKEVTIEEPQGGMTEL